MPLYIYHNIVTDEYVEIVQRMNETHQYSGISGDEDCWRRVFTVPNASIDAHLDPFSSKDFVNKTQNKKGTYGDLLDRSAEMSDKRASLAGGKDPVKEQYFSDYSAKRRGAKHPDQMKTFENNKIKVDFGKK
jgi:hypothetical protein